jgi:hypothetical protein
VLFLTIGTLDLIKTSNTSVKMPSVCACRFAETKPKAKLASVFGTKVSMHVMPCCRPVVEDSIFTCHLTWRLLT